MTRRLLMGWFLSLLAALPFRRLQPFAQPAGLPQEGVETLRELGAVVLPSSVRSTDPEAIVSSFLRWLEGYRSGAEMSHGYGKPRTRRTPTVDAALYMAQLEKIRRAARSRGGSLQELSPEDVRALIESSLAEAGIERLPGRPDGRHVISDLMSYYFNGSDARDHCYQARVERHRCQGREGMSARPASL